MALAALVAGALTTRPWAFTEFSLLGYPATGTHSILPAEFYWVSTEFSRLTLLGFYWLLPSFTGFYLVFTGFRRVLLGLTLFLPGFIEFYWVLPSFTWFT